MVCMYIDPNSGGMLFQVLAGAFAAVTGLFLLFSGRIRVALGKLRRKARESGQKDLDSKE